MWPRRVYGLILKKIKNKTKFQSKDVKKTRDIKVQGKQVYTYLMDRDAAMKVMSLGYECLLESMRYCVRHGELCGREASLPLLL